MQDDTLWKPPADAGEPAVPSPEEQPSVVAPHLPAPTLPNADVSNADVSNADVSEPDVSNADVSNADVSNADVSNADVSNVDVSGPRLPEPHLPAPPPVAPPSPWSPDGADAAGGAAPSSPADQYATPNPIGHVVPAGQLIEPGSPGDGTRPRRSKWLVGGAVAAVMAVGGAGVFAVSNLTGSTAGGAASPEELGVDMLLAIENEDVLGAIDLLLPGERASLGEPFVEMISELQRLDVLAATDLSQISGIDLELSGEDVQVRATNVDDIANIDLRADVVVSVDGAELPIGEIITDNMPDDMVTELRGTRVTETDSFDIWLTAVESEGQWYFSLLHSAAELARQEAVPGSDIPLVGVGAVGTDTPEGAIDAMLDSVEALDLTALIQSLNPGEAAALQRYAPLFLDDVDSALAEVPLDWQITEREFRVEGDGETRTVFIDALAVDGRLDGSAFSAGFGDGCFRASAEGEEFEQCGDTLAADDALDQIFGDQPDVLHLIETIQAAFADVEPAGLELRNTDGAWYVSPIGTGSEAMLKAIRALTRDELDDIIAAFEPAMSGFEDAIVGSINDLAGTAGTGGFGDPFEVIEPGQAIEDDVAVAEPQSPVIVDPGETGTDTSAESGWLQCYDETDTAAATSCFEGYVESGDIDRTAIPAVLRHPECGFAEVAWTNSIYSLPDDEFVAVAEASRDCFLALIDGGEVSAYELPSEITHLDCFEGRNWYQVFDDPDYDERYYDCIGSGFDD